MRQDVQNSKELADSTGKYTICACHLKYSHCTGKNPLRFDIRQQEAAKQIRSSPFSV